jgi:AcrR family transcriptional regulator
MDAPDSKRELILQATWRLIRHYGYAKTTISDIARGAGIGKGTVYLYFPSKADIMLALVDRTNERITRDLERIAAGTGAPDKRLRKCLLHRVMTIFDLVRRYPHGEDVITSIKPEIVRRIDVHVKKQGRLLAAVIREGCRAGDFKTDDHEAAGLLLANLFEHFTPPYWRFRTRKSLERFAGAVLDMVMTGL